MIQHFIPYCISTNICLLSRRRRRSRRSSGRCYLYIYIYLFLSININTLFQVRYTYTCTYTHIKKCRVKQKKRKKERKTYIKPQISNFSIQRINRPPELVCRRCISQNEFGSFCRPIVWWRGDSEGIWNFIKTKKIIFLVGVWRRIRTRGNVIE